MQFDIAVIGAGPAGLCFARALAGSGLTVALVEQQTEEVLAAPPFDGREIALTHASRRLLERYGVWQQLPQDEISPLRDAQILNGPSLFAMKIAAADSGQAELGYLVPNHCIRAAAYRSVQQAGEVTLLSGVRLQSLEQGRARIVLQLSDGQRLETRLLVAADSRFSDTRRMLGIAASMRDFGRSMLLCRMAHAELHQHVAWEWFDYGQTLALLPLPGNRSGVVLTLPQHAIQALADLPDEAFCREMERRFAHRLGRMHAPGSRHVYPLIGVYAQRFVAPRAALIGDAAVGMHPVTAHGFNFGLQAGERLASRLLAAQAAGRDIAATSLLEDYERSHRLATWPLYQGTNLIAGLYTDDRPPARLLRNVALHLADRLSPFKRAIAAHLTQAA